ncbi:sigma factor-binding protein Crl [Serratia ureilytica]
MKRFASLGPYLREGQCENGPFSLIVWPIPSSKALPGEALSSGAGGWSCRRKRRSFTYSYQFGLFDKEGDWTAQNIRDDEANAKLEDTQATLHRRLGELLATMELGRTRRRFQKKLIKLSA